MFWKGIVINLNSFHFSIEMFGRKMLFEGFIYDTLYLPPTNIFILLLKPSKIFPGQEITFITILVTTSSKRVRIVSIYCNRFCIDKFTPIGRDQKIIIKLVWKTTWNYDELGDWYLKMMPESWCQLRRACGIHIIQRYAYTKRYLFWILELRKLSKISAKEFTWCRLSRITTTGGLRIPAFLDWLLSELCCAWSAIVAKYVRSSLLDLWSTVNIAKVEDDTSCSCLNRKTNLFRLNKQSDGREHIIIIT